MEEKLYSIRVSFIHGNAIDIDLKGSGTLHIKPNKEYFFINAPLSFTKYLAQLKRLGISYKITTDKKGCYQEIDLREYDKKNAYKLVSNLREAVSLEPPKIKEPPTVVLSSDDNIKKDVPVVEDTTPVDLSTPEAVQEPVVEPPVEEVVPEETTPEVEPQSEETTEPKVYTEEELLALSKKELLAISSSLDLTVSEINTKKEIREAILEKQSQ